MSAASLGVSTCVRAFLPRPLTASERRVAEKAEHGLGNTEIAQTLFVTRKTVEKHLGNAYTKLDVKSRSELSRCFRNSVPG